MGEKVTLKTIIRDTQRRGVVTPSHFQAPQQDAALSALQLLSSAPHRLIASLLQPLPRPWRPFWKALLSYKAKSWLWKIRKDSTGRFLTLRANIPEALLSNFLFTNTALPHQHTPKSNSLKTNR